MPKKKKKSGRKAHWSGNALDDFVDIIVNNAKYQRKLIFTNTKNHRNGYLYDEILKELKKRCSSRKEAIDFTIPQLRNKFKKCVAECKRIAMTIKTATGVKRVQEEKGYGAWFDRLFPLVQSRDSCQSHLAVEPSSSCTTSDPFEDVEEDPDQSECKETAEKSGVKQFVPTRKKKVTPKDQMGEAVELFKSVLEHDTTKDIINYMRDEAEKARQHELEITKMILNSVNPGPSGSTETHNQPHHSLAYSQVPNANYQHHSFHYNQVAPQYFPSTVPTHTDMNSDDGDSSHKCHYSL